MSSIDFWRGDDGRDYTIRQPDLGAASALKAILRPWLADIHSVLEVGCNRGDNLRAFDCEATGVEPNQYARDVAADDGFFVVDAVAHNLPFPSGSFDLVFTAGVLIHIPPLQFPLSLAEIHRVSSRFVLAVEYSAPYPKPLDYRGQRAGIWKRPYGVEYGSRFPDLQLVGQGATGPEFDGCQWWFFEKCPLAEAA